MFQTHVIKYFLLLKKMLCEVSLGETCRLYRGWSHQASSFALWPSSPWFRWVKCLGKTTEKWKVNFALPVSWQEKTENLSGSDQSHTNYALKESLLYHPFYQKGGAIYERNIVLCWGTLKLATVCSSKKSTLDCLLLADLPADVLLLIHRIILT